MTCIKEIAPYNGKVINTFKTTGKNAYKELSILLINALNNKKTACVSNYINKKGLHEIKGSIINNGYVYSYHFKGDELERLPIISY